MQEERIKKLESSVTSLVGYVRMMLLVMLFMEIIALGAIFLAVAKIGEFWMVSTRNIYQRIEQLEGEHDKGR